MKKIILILNLLLNAKSWIYINSIPKSGTHLAMKTIGLICDLKYTGLALDSSGYFNETAYNLKQIYNNKIIYGSHQPFSNYSKVTSFFNNEKIKLFLIIRDPRDLIVSTAYWIKKVNNLDCDVKILIDHIIESDQIKNDYEELYFAWRRNCNSLTIKFEKLIGQEGGGSNQDKTNTINEIINYLEIKPSTNLINTIENKIYGETASFREGKINSWKKEFTKEQINKVNQKFKQLIIDLGYSLE
jgi:hypothetical protein